MVKQLVLGALAALAALVVLALGTVEPALAQSPPVIKIDNRKFDHDKHAKVSASAGKPATCATCHTFDANGERTPGREHPRCAQCHTYPRACDVMKQAGPKGQARVCQVCHTPTSTRCLPSDLPPLPKTDTYEARFTHGKHLALGTSIEKDCAQCHAAQAPSNPPKVASHKLCSGCHNPNGAKPTMDQCQSCHQVPKGKTAAAADSYRLGSFDHRAHHTASRQSSCLGCHDKLLGAGDSALPRPSMLGCQTRCHDGQKAFRAVGTNCTKCHKGRGSAAAADVPPTRQDMSFSHTAHAGRNVQIQNCAQCHTLEADGKLTSPLAKKDHMPCAASGCHQTEFANRATKICGICHDAAVPWQKTSSRAKPQQKPEWFERINHAQHLGLLGNANTACQMCHGDKLAGGATPTNHAACAPCHGRGQGPAMAQCANCHAQTPPPRAAISEWSVRATFDHKEHANDPRSRSATKCTECHKQVASAKDLASIQTPRMADCDGCHNGRAAFKTTGFDCSRCHTPVNSVAPAAPKVGSRELRERLVVTSVVTSTGTR